MTTLAAGTTQQETATGHYSDSSTADLTSQCNWSSSDPTVVTVGNGETILPPTPPVNLDFEYGDFTGWSLTNDGEVNPTVPYFGYTPHQGNFMGVVGGPPSSFFSHDNVLSRLTADIFVPAVPGLTWTLRFWAGFFKVDFGVGQGTQVGQLYNSSGALLHTFFNISPAIDAAGVWTEYTFDITPYAGVTSLRLQFNALNQGGGPYGMVFVDDVHITVSPTTNPKGMLRAVGVAGKQAIVIAKFPNGVAGTTLVKLT